LKHPLDNRLCGGKNAHIYYGSIAEDEAMCGADLSDVENENMKDDQDNSQRKTPKKDMDDKTRAKKFIPCLSAIMMFNRHIFC
jgi:hypothetical protein